MIVISLTDLTALPIEAPVFIYGTGRGGRCISRALRLTTSLELVGFVDTHQSGLVDGIRVYSLAEFKARPREAATLIIASVHFDEILAALGGMAVGSCFDARPMFQNLTGLDERLEDGPFAELFNLSRHDVAGFRTALKGRERTRAPSQEEIEGLAREVEPALRRLVARHVDIGALASLLQNLLQAIDQDFRNPHLRKGFAGPFNGQYLRTAIMRGLDAELDFDAFVETGAFRGTTTEWLASLGRPVFACELNPDLFHFALARLAQVPNAHMVQQDSRAFLTDFCAANGKRFQRPFFYLDAHWNDDLPLFEEIDLIADHFECHVVMADDFKNPFHPYQFDSYGPDAELTMECMLPRLRNRDKLCFLFPNFPRDLETGGGSGTLVIAPIGMRDRLLAQTALLKEFAP